jgi:hypothetical protein
MVGAAFTLIAERLKLKEIWLTMPGISYLNRGYNWLKKAKLFKAPKNPPPAGRETSSPKW